MVLVVLITKRLREDSSATWHFDDATLRELAPFQSAPAQARAQCGEGHCVTLTQIAVCKKVDAKTGPLR